jgi:hypothetical protein
MIVKDKFDINIFNEGAYQNREDRWVLSPYSLKYGEDMMFQTNELIGEYTLYLTKDEAFLLGLEGNHEIDTWIESEMLKLEQPNMPTRVKNWIDNVTLVL